VLGDLRPRPAQGWYARDERSDAPGRGVIRADGAFVMNHWSLKDGKPYSFGLTLVDLFSLAARVGFPQAQSQAWSL